VSSPLAIATVTAVLKDLLNDGLINSNLAASVGTFAVSALPPDRIATGAQEPNQLNLFLYQVTANSGWRNADQPSRNGGGDQRLTNAPLALDLHYLLTAYGAADLDAEILLGYAMQLLHETPVLTRGMIRKTFSVTSPVTDKLLPPSATDHNAADLADQVELCKITPKYLTTEELSRMWSAMQARYRPTMAYQVSVVLIQRTGAAKSPLPVRVPKFFVGPMSRPFIESLSPQQIADGAVLAVLGQNLKGATTIVRVGGMRVVPAAGDVGDAQIKLTLPAGLRAGIVPVQVVHEVPLGEPPVPHPGAGYESNVAALVLIPQVTTPQPISVARGAVLTLGIAPAVGREQRVTVLIGESALPVPQRPATDPPTASNVGLTIPADFATGTFLLRVQVDGAISALDVDTNPVSPTFNQYIGPNVTIT
jgi:hypothetical protein